MFSSGTCFEIADQIEGFYRQSVRKHPQMFTEQHVDQVKRFLLKTCPEKMLQLSQEFVPLFKVDRLNETKISCVQKQLEDSMPALNSDDDLQAFRRMYDKDFQEYSAEIDTLLLPKGPLKSSVRFHELYWKLLRETNEFLWMLMQCRHCLDLMQPPFGNEKNFANKVLSMLIELIQTLMDGLKNQQIHLLATYEDRAEEFRRIYKSPQLNDLRLSLQMEEQQIFVLFEIYSQKLQFNYGSLYQFARKNIQVIQENFQQGLIHAKYKI